MAKIFTHNMSTHKAGYKLVVRDICVNIGPREILKNIDGVATPGEILAIMGPSGAGKTTLLDSIAGRKEATSGFIILDGNLMDKQLMRKISYVTQSDIFLSEISTWDTLWFNAVLRLPDSMPKKDKLHRVNSIVDALDMRKYLKTKVGGPMSRGLSGGEKKRLNIACELLTDPALMLLDEPTSGLDSSTAHSLISTLKQYAAVTGITIVMTIHQPSSQIFNMFDKLLLLSEGEVAYYGEVNRCADHFAEIQIPCPPNYNIAEHILDLTKRKGDVRKGLKEGLALLKGKPWYPQQLLLDASCSYKAVSKLVGMLLPPISANGNQPQDTNSSEAEQLSSNGEGDQTKRFTNQSFTTDGEDIDIEEGHDKLAQIADTWDDDHVKYKKEYTRKWPTCFFTQFLALTRRGFWHAYPRILKKWTLIQLAILSVAVGIMWFQTEPIEEKIQDRLGLLFYSLMLISMSPCADGVIGYHSDKVVLNKERLGSYYRLSAYFLSKSMVEALLSITLPALYITVVYWMTGLNSHFSVFIQMLLVICLNTTLAQSIGFLFGVIVPDISVGMMLIQTTVMFGAVAGGFYVQDVPVWADWLRYLSFLRFSFFTLATIDLSNKDIRCATTRSSSFASCLNDNTTDMYIDRQEVLDSLTPSSDGWELYHYIIWLLGVLLLVKIATYIALRFIRKPRAA